MFRQERLCGFGPELS